MTPTVIFLYAFIVAMVVFALVLTIKAPPPKDRRRNEWHDGTKKDEDE